MIAALLIATLGLSSGTQEAFYVDASLDLDGDLLSWRFVDVDLDGSRELVVAVRRADGERELRVHPLVRSGLERTARTTVRVLPDAIAWGAADVREEPGRELLFLTKNGAWSYSPTLPGYRDNVARLAEEPLVYDVPDPRRLPYWGYVLAGTRGERVLLPGRDRMTVWAPAPDELAQPSDYVLEAALPTSEIDTEGVRMRASGRSRSDGPSVPLRGETPFLREGTGEITTLLEDAYAYDAPALLDLDGDGRTDLAVLGEESLALYVAGEDGLPSEPTRVEPLPEALRTNEEGDGDDGEEREVELRLADVDGDGLVDAVARVADPADGFENRLHRILVYLARPGRLLGEEPDQVLRFEAGDLEFGVVDVDGDGRRDLTVEKLELPSLVGTVTGIEFTFSLLVFRGEERGFGRRPVLSQEATYDEQTAGELAASRRWTHDCDGDGTVDLVEIDLAGDLTIRRLRRESSRFRGESWTLDRAPWKRFELEGSVESLGVGDFNGDGLGDVVSATEDRLVVLLSARAGGGR